MDESHGSSKFLRLVGLMGELLDQLKLLGWIQVERSGRYQLLPGLYKELKEWIPSLVEQTKSSSIQRFSCKLMLELSAEAMVNRYLREAGLDRILDFQGAGCKMLAQILAMLAALECRSCPNLARNYADPDQYLKSIRSWGCITSQLGYV